MQTDNILLDFFPALARRHKDAYQLTESRGESRSRMAKLILTLPSHTPSLHTAPVSTDPTKSDFTAFNVYDGRTDNLLCTFRANDIVQQRRFMAALGSKGPGLFSQCNNTTTSANTPNTRLQDLVSRQQTFNKMSQNFQVPEVCRNIPKSFEEALQKFPSEYYFQTFELPPHVLPGVTLSHCDPSSHAPFSRVSQRRAEFRPPHGPPTDYHSMIGCGAAAGLEHGQIVVWDHKNEFYYFLDCNRKAVYACELRSKPNHKPSVRKSQISIQKGQSEKSLSLPPCDPAIVRATAERALRKPHGCVLKASGKKGRNGMTAVSAAKGKRGSDGVTGESVSSLHAVAGGDGGDGGPGDNGRHAELGEDGGMGKNVIVELYGNAKELGIDGTCQSVARLGGEEYEEVLLVDCSGGDGGDGGDGGGGGSGGDGGDGGMGQNGGDGGHGGVGGKGGRGGNGGNAGCGGRGGNCVIRTSDPQLLMLVEVKCDSGRPGRAGSAGRGGSGGKMGFGGAGSSAEHSSNKDAGSGLQGKPGRTGISGDDGIDGESGFTHRAGSLQWVITSQDGQVISSASTRFEAEVLSMGVTSCSDGGVFEPHQVIQVTDIVVVNSGGLPLPEGAKVSIPSTETVRFDPTVYTLPRLEPGEEFVVPAVFRGQIVDEPSPNGPGPLISTCRFAPKIELLGRPFDKSRLEQSLTVQYPIKLAYALANNMVSNGAVTTLEIGIENLSSVSYGMCSESRGSVLVRVLLDSSLHPLGLGNSPTDPDKKSKTDSTRRDFVAKYDQNTNSVFILVEDLGPGGTLSVPLVVKLDGEAELGDSCRWQTEVYLRGKLIEYNSAEMRVAPKYSNGNSAALQLADVLLVKTKSLREIEMLFWQRIFELLEVSFDYWDTNREGEESEDGFLPPFQQKYKFIVHPHCSLESLNAEDIVSHFKTDNDSSMLLLLDAPTPDSLEKYIQENEGNKKMLRLLCAKEKSVDVSPELYSGCHLVSPGTIVPVDSTLQKAQKHVLKKLEREVSLHASMIVGQSGIIRRQGMTYSYGKLNIKRCPISRTANFQCIDGAASHSMEMGADDPHLTTDSRDIPLATNFGQIFLATLAGLPLHLKLNLLRKSPDQQSALSVNFHLPNGGMLTRTDLAAVCLAKDIVDEVFSGSSDLPRMHKLIKVMKDGRSSNTMDTAIFSQLLDLIKREANQRQAKLSKKLASVSQALKHLSSLCTSTAHSLPSSTTSLPHLSQLQNTLTTLHPHQITSDELFDLSH